jgi:predicted RNA methylase
MSVALLPAAREVLNRATVDGFVIRLPPDKLDRPTYAAVDKVLVAMGGKWDRKKGGHAFPFDPAEKLAAALTDGSVVSRQKKLQLFETPTDLAERLVVQLGYITGMVCLEPSAGRGRIIQSLAARDPATIIAVEIDADNSDALREQGKSHEIITGDFLQQNPANLQCDVVAMNPPFTRNQDIKHVRHAYECLLIGGRLAAIVSEHGFIAQHREAVEWRAWLEELGAEIEIIPAGTFKESGTGVQTRMIVLRKGEAA